MAGTPQRHLPIRLSEWAPAPRRVPRAAWGFWNNPSGGSPVQEERAEPSLWEGTRATEALLP